MEKIKLLEKENLKKSKVTSILNFLFNSKEKKELHFTPDTDKIKIFGRFSNKLFLRNPLTEKYFNRNELIDNYIDLGLKKSINSNNFLKWIGVREATNNKIVKIIFDSEIDRIDRVKDLISIYNINSKITLPDIDFYLPNKKSELKKVKELYIDNQNSKFCKDEKVVANFDFEVNQDFFKWLGLSEPTKNDLVERFLELLSQSNLTLANRKEIIILLSKKYNKDEHRDTKQVLFLINNKNEIKKSSELYQVTDIAKKHIPNDLINSDLKLDKDFLEWLGVEEAHPKKIIKKLLDKEKINYLDIFEIWNNDTSKIGKSLNDNRIKVQAPKLFNRDKKNIFANNLFLEKEETPFYQNSELIAEFKDLGLDNCNIAKVEDFLVWLGVNRYIKYKEENNYQKVYRLNDISKLEFNKLILLLEKENILKNRGALKYSKS